VCVTNYHFHLQWAEGNHMNEAILLCHILNGLGDILVLLLAALDAIA